MTKAEKDRENERLRWGRLSRAIRRVKELAWKTGRTHYVVRHGRWAYHVTTRLPRCSHNIVYFSNKGE